MILGLTMEVKHEYALETTVLPNQRFDAVVLGWHMHFRFGFSFFAK
jgi:hypothetical protein